MFLFLNTVFNLRQLKRTTDLCQYCLYRNFGSYLKGQFAKIFCPFFITTLFLSHLQKGEMVSFFR